MFLNPLCPCKSQLHYSQCCEPYHKGTTIAPTAEALMRSRYSAYSKGQVEYLLQTQHPKTRKNDDGKLLTDSIKSTQWIGLTILKTQKGNITDRRGIVEFVALYTARQNPLQTPQTPTPKPVQLHERSRFIKEKEQWFYVDGDILPPVKLKSEC
jgi:SEC-C motif domain protein